MVRRWLKGTGLFMISVEVRGRLDKDGMFYICVLTEIVCKLFSKCSLKTYICEFDEIYILSFEPENRDVL